MKIKKIRPIKYNPLDIQTLLNSGLTWRQVSDQLGVSMKIIAKYKNRGLIKTRSHSEAILLSLMHRPPQKHSETSKQKISIARKKYLAENPDKIPYILNHKSKGRVILKPISKNVLKFQII